VRKFVLLSLLLTLSSCGYRMGFGPIPNCYETISVPFIEGDQTGSLTAAIVEEISTSGAFTYCPCSADLTLNIILLEIKDKNIGFRYDRGENNEIQETIVPAETRLTAIAKVTLVDNRSCEIVSGPDIIKAKAEFDHEFNSSRDAVNVFSLGQVTEIEEAKVAAKRPLDRALAKKIVDYLISAW